MKKIIVTMMLLLAVNISYVAADEKKNPSEYSKIEMDIINVSGSNEIERNINIPIISATLYSSTKEIEVTLCNIGEADVYIVDSQNQVINSTTVYTDFPTVVSLCVTGEEGKYYIIVMSDNFYAEGKFTL